MSGKDRDVHKIRWGMNPHLPRRAGLRLTGRAVLSVYPRGLIARLMRRYSGRDGYTFDSARWVAERFLVHRSSVSNLIVTSGKVLVCRMLMDDGAQWDTGLTYHAIGTGSTAVAVGDTTLTTETGRKAITSKSRSGNEVTFSTFFPVADCTVKVAECGVFGSSTAGAGADSGELMCHYLQAYDNSGGNFDLTFDWVLTVG